MTDHYLFCMYYVTDFASFTNRQKNIDVTISKMQDAAYSASLKASAEARPLATEFVKLVNAMGSAYSNQLQAMWFHPPRIIWLTLILLILIGSFLAGYKMGVTQRRERLLSFHVCRVDLLCHLPDSQP